MNEDNKIVHNERKIVDSNYPPRSSNSTRVYGLFYMAGSLLDCLSYMIYFLMDLERNILLPEYN